MSISRTVGRVVGKAHELAMERHRMPISYIHFNNEGKFVVMFGLAFGGENTPLEALLVEAAKSLNVDLTWKRVNRSSNGAQYFQLDGDYEIAESSFKLGIKQETMTWRGGLKKDHVVYVREE